MPYTPPSGGGAPLLVEQVGDNTLMLSVWISTPWQ